jgi:hypothetical protein
MHLSVVALIHGAAIYRAHVYHCDEVVSRRNDTKTNICNVHCFAIMSSISRNCHLPPCSYSIEVVGL